MEKDEKVSQLVALILAMDTCIINNILDFVGDVTTNPTEVIIHSDYEVKRCSKIKSVKSH